MNVLTGRDDDMHVDTTPSWHDMAAKMMTYSGSVSLIISIIITSIIIIIAIALCGEL